jgi:hypothetical protein
MKRVSVQLVPGGNYQIPILLVLVLVVVLEIPRRPEDENEDDDEDEPKSPVSGQTRIRLALHVVLFALLLTVAPNPCRHVMVAQKVPICLDRSPRAVQVNIEIMRVPPRRDAAAAAAGVQRRTGPHAGRAGKDIRRAQNASKKSCRSRSQFATLKVVTNCDHVREKGIKWKGK